MKESINLNEVLNKSEIEYDFRKYADYNDEFTYLFEQWIPYYDLKYKICEELKPKSILEVGVRFGYLAKAFLSATPKARYIGIYDDSSLFVRDKEKINWAETINREYDCNFMELELQNYKNFFNQGSYDLIHVNKQEDGDVTYKILELALEKSTWILVDGYHQSTENMLSISFFIEKYKRFIEYSIIIPGYSGELLIKVKKNVNIDNKSYKNLMNEYDKDYYIKDCGGFESFLKTKGKEIDGRLKELLDIVNPQKGERILDIGCGRGELAYAISQRGATCFGVDYSNDAIKLAKETYMDALGERLNFINMDIVDLGREYTAYFDKIILADVYEHIEQEIMNKILETIKDLLNDNGLLFIHTAPNLHYYDKVYDLNRKIAKDIGLFLPKNPRTVYEDIMHINEQTPESLKNHLKKCFKYAKVWCNHAEVLLNQEQNQDDNLNNEIFAISSNENIIDSHLKDLSYGALDSSDINIKLLVENSSNGIIKFNDFVNVKIQNYTKQVLATRQPFPVHVSYHILNNKKEVVLFDGERTSLDTELQPGDMLEMKMKIARHGLKKGIYIYRICLVQEFQFWFENSYTDILIEV